MIFQGTGDTTILHSDVADDPSRLVLGPLVNTVSTRLRGCIAGHGDCEILGGGVFYFHPYLGKIPILTNIFQRG